MDAILQACALAHEERATAQQLSATAGLEIRNPNRRKEINTEELGQLVRINRIGLRARLPNQLAVECMRDPHGIAVFRETRRQPLPVERRFKPDGHRPRQRAEPGNDRLERGGELPDLGDDRTGRIAVM